MAVNRKTLRLLIVGTGLVVALAASWIASDLTRERPPDSAAAQAASFEPIERTDQAEAGREVPLYYDALREWEAANLRPGSERIDVAASAFARRSADPPIATGAYAGASDALLWREAEGWVEYEVYAEQAGLYELHVRYHPLDTDAGVKKLLLAATLNGEAPYREARSMTLDRWVEEPEPPRFDEKGNQLRAFAREIEGWRTDALRDADGAYAGPLLWPLNEGRNVLRLELLAEPAAIESLHFVPPRPIPAYADVRAAYPADARRTGEPIVLEAERFARKNTAAVQTMYDRDPLTTPLAYHRVRLNALGGWTWAKGRQSVTWTFEVPEDGLYNITLRVKQNYRENLASFRTVRIDGDIPFAELAAYRFQYAPGWQSVTLSDENGTPYDFLLARGVHTITLESTYEPFVPMIMSLDRMSDRLGDLYSDLKRATGNRVDAFRVWDVEAELPGLTDSLRDVQRQLQAMYDGMLMINGKRDNIAQTLLGAVKDIETMLKEPEKLPGSAGLLASLQENVDRIRGDLLEGPLAIEKLALSPADEEPPRMKASFWEKTVATLSVLYHSFDAANRLDHDSEEKLIVWMNWGRDYVNELQRLADESFTPKYGIEVDINLIPTPDLFIPSSVAGILPDVALGVPDTLAFELALRGAAKNLAELPGADDLFANYAPGALLPYYYDGGYYGVPETMNIKVLFYRKDILESLGLEVPDTWEDVYRMLPTLAESDYMFYVPPSDFSYMFYQHGAEFYTPDGLSSALDSPEAFEAFREWTDLFNRYGLERQVQSFYNHFRRGTMPIGIADFNQYMQLLVAAPELANRWAIAPVPGRVNEDGVVERWISSQGDNGVASTSAMMFNRTSERKQEAAWAFIRWYLSEETQTAFGMNLEMFYGEAFRWNSAHIDAFAAMPWKSGDLPVFLRQWKWVKELPNVPGGYMTGRELGFAWNRAVIDMEKPRVALDKAVKQINRELLRKQREFGLVDERGAPRTSLELPQITDPWEVADTYAEQYAN